MSSTDWTPSGNTRFSGKDNLPELDLGQRWRHGYTKKPIIWEEVPLEWWSSESYFDPSLHSPQQPLHKSHRNSILFKLGKNKIKSPPKSVATKDEN